MNIKRISVSGFKRFSKFEVTCRGTNVLVGPNNAGKSTLLDVLRLTNDVFRFAKRRKPVVKNQPDDGARSTYLIEHSVISIPIENVCKDYGEESASIEIDFEDKNSIAIKLHPDRQVEAYLRTEGALPKSTAQFKKLFPSEIVVVPTLSPLERDEELYQLETIQKNENTRLASRNFRNIWYRKTREQFSEFESLISNSWEGIKVRPPELTPGYPSFVQMFFEEDRITREVYWAGFGFQVWLQIMTQIVGAKPNAIFVLDEPDIYLHSDLQRKLIRLLKDRFRQFFVATHSADIINECDPGDIVLVDNSKLHGKRVTTDKSYHELFSILGSAENAEFARFARAKRVFFFEGKDKKILKKFAKRLDNKSLLDDPDTAYLQAGGFEQWRRIKELNWTLTQVFGIDVKIAAMFDRDYKSDEEVQEFENNLTASGIFCCVLNKKEIENYAIARPPLRALLSKKAAAKNITLSKDVVDSILEEVAETFREEVRGQVLSKQLFYQKSKAPHLDDATLIKPILAEFDKRWAHPDDRFSILPGKAYLSCLSTILQERYGFSISATQVINAMNVCDINDELRDKIIGIEKYLKANK